MTNIEKLRKLLLEKAYRGGTIVLSSGKKSDFYIDVKVVALIADGAKLIGKCFAEIIKRNNIKTDAVAGVTLGGDPLVTATSIETGLPGLIIRKKPKEHGTSKQIEGIENVPIGSNVVLLEDVVTTGGTVLERGAEILKRAGYNVVAIIAVVDRQENDAGKIIEEKGYPFFSIFTKESLLAFKK